MYQPKRNNSSPITFNFSSAIFLSNAASILDHALQPLIDMQTGELAGVEALLRNVDQLGLDHPRQVFDTAHELKCLSNLESILRRKAIEKFASSDMIKRSKLFLNIDARLSNEEDYLLDETVELLEQFGLHPSCVMLELSETQDISNFKNFDAFVEKARRLDFGLAVDDFGQGFAQMKSLYDFEPNILKIDRFFITAIQADSRKRLLVSSLVNMAHTLGMRVVAEGVETKAEFAICKQVGCDLAQGFLVARPTTHVPAILQNYSHRFQSARPENHAGSERESIISKEIRPIVALPDDAAMEDVLDRFRGNRSTSLIPIVNAFNEPRGVIKEADIKQLVYMPYGQDLLCNKTVNRHIMSFVHRCPTADINSAVDQLVGLVASEDDESEGILITRNGKYFGFLTTSALLKISNEMRMREAEDLNPLTKLPGNNSVKAFVLAAALEAETDRSFCYIDFDFFKPFNDIYGFQTGDRAILLFSELAKKFGAETSDFLGHIGGDDFFMGFRGKDRENVQQTMVAVWQEFRHQAESFYDPEHREAGFIRSKGRSGEMTDFPLLSSSIAILHLPKGVSVENQDILWRQIANLKQSVKAETCGILATTFGENAPQKAA
ncbi:MAG: GGDEF domain-containing protein [Rhodobacteraceae bacterium]|nr:GGDEF domain-containing protein [Paracoccaceae bacterium]